MPTLHTDPLKIIGNDIFELKLSAGKHIEKLRGEVKKATNGHLETIATDLQRVLAFHEAVEGLASSFARMADDDNVSMSLLRRLGEINMRMSMVKTWGNSQSAAAIEGRTAALRQVFVRVEDELRDVLRAQ